MTSPERVVAKRILRNNPFIMFIWDGNRLVALDDGVSEEMYIDAIKMMFERLGIPVIDAQWRELNKLTPERRALRNEALEVGK